MCTAQHSIHTINIQHGTSDLYKRSARRAQAIAAYNNKHLSYVLHVFVHINHVFSLLVQTSIIFIIIFKKPHKSLLDPEKVPILPNKMHKNVSISQKTYNCSNRPFLGTFRHQNKIDDPLLMDVVKRRILPV